MAINKKIKVEFPVVKKLPEVFIGKNSANNNKKKGNIKLLLKFKLSEFLFFKKIVIKLIMIIKIVINPTIPISESISK